MKRLTYEFDFWNHKELKDYLLSLDGVKKVNIDDEKNLILDIQYDEKKIGPKTLKYEVLAFMDVDYPSLVWFDLHEKNKEKYTMLIKDVCCEYCYMDMIEELFNTKGIVSAKSNYNVVDFCFNDKLEIEYDPKLISLEDIKKMEKELNE